MLNKKGINQNLENTKSKMKDIECVQAKYLIELKRRSETKKNLAYANASLRPTTH